MSPKILIADEIYGVCYELCSWLVGWVEDREETRNVRVWVETINRA